MNYNLLTLSIVFGIINSIMWIVSYEIIKIVGYGDILVGTFFCTVAIAIFFYSLYERL